ncbi:MAG TPA: hypothetical protein VGK74_00305 [Symbiobacteriaceae bacterium]
MRAARLFIISLCLLLAGCGGVSAPAPATPSAPAAPAPEPVPVAVSTPGTGAKVSLEDLCKDAQAMKKDIPPTAFVDALLTLVSPVEPSGLKETLEAARKKSSCLTFDINKDGEPLVLVGLRFTPQRAILWRQGNQWQAVNFPKFSDMTRILAQSEGGAGREVLFDTEAEGTGHYGSFGLLRLKGNEWQLLYQSPTYDHFGATLLDPKHVLVLARNVKDVPLAWPANYAIPTNYQWLYERKDYGFNVAAERVVPDPAYTVSVFFGALQQKKDDWLAKVATPEAVAAARRLKLDDPAVQISPPNAISVSSKPEYLYWSALPAANQGPAPAVTTGTATAQVTKGMIPVVKLDLKRTAAGWVVTAVGPVQ